MCSSSLELRDDRRIRSVDPAGAFPLSLAGTISKSSMVLFTSLLSSTEMESSRHLLPCEISDQSASPDRTELTSLLHQLWMNLLGFVACLQSDCCRIRLCNRL